MRTATASIRLAPVVLAALWSAEASACSVRNPATVPEIGPYSPAAVKAGAPPAGTLSGGIDCSGTAISLAGGNVLTATIGNANGYRMTPDTAEPVTFRLYADQAATKPLSTSGATNFLNPQLIDLVGLLGNSPSDIPLYVKVASTNPVAPGSYAGSFRITWTWKFCSGVWVGATCTLGTLTQGTQSATIAFTLAVAARPVTAAITTATTWDPISGTLNPRAFPRSRGRATITLSNPDIVAIDAGSLVVDLPTATKTAVALDGDGTGGPVVRTTPGGSGLSLTYGDPAATADDVEFSADHGASFTYVPVAGNPASQGAVTTVRFRPQGSMAAGSTFVISLPYSLQ